MNAEQPLDVEGLRSAIDAIYGTKGINDRVVTLSKEQATVVVSQVLNAYLAASPATGEVTEDYFDDLVVKAKQSAAKARVKFPQPNYVTLKIAEEAGEVVRGAIHYAEDRMEWGEVEGEIVQLLAMLIRFITEGDEVNNVIPPLYVRENATVPTATPKPIAIWNKADAKAYYKATEQEQKDWNDYAQAEADKFSDTLDANESIGQYTGRDREGNITDWCPPLFFSEWLAQRRPTPAAPADGLVEPVAWVDGKVLDQIASGGRSEKAVWLWGEGYADENVPLYSATALASAEARAADAEATVRLLSDQFKKQNDLSAATQKQE